MSRTVIITILFFALYALAGAQVNVRGPILSLQVMDSVKKVGLPGAHVTLVSGKDTINIITNESGHLNYNGPLTDSVVMTVSYIGYELYQQTIRIPAFMNVYLVERKHDIAEIVVVGEALAVVMKGDTVQFNAAAFKTFEGDPMTKLFELLPGMKLEEGSLSYLGEKIHRVTIDGNRLFGDDTMLALENIRADDVVDVNVYKEADDWDKLNEFENPILKTVADVRTKSKPAMVRNTTLVGGVGAETEREDRKSLYDLSGKRVYSRVGETMTMNAAINNTPVFQNYEGRNMGAGFTYLKNNSNKSIFSTKNKFNNTRNSHENWSHRDYFPTKDYSSRDYFSRESKTSRKTDFTNETQIRHTFRDKSMIEHFGIFSYTDDVRRSGNIISAMQDGTVTQRRDIGQRDKNRSLTYVGRLVYARSFRSNIRLRVEATANVSDNNGDGWRLDTLASSTSRIYLINDNNGYNRDLSGGVYLTFPFRPTLSLEVSDQISYVDTKSTQTSNDILTGFIDPTNAWDYRIHEVNNTAGTGLTYNNNVKLKGVTQAMVDFRWINRNMRREEFFPDQYEYPRHFNLIHATASMNYKLSGFNELKLSYFHWEQPVAITDLRDFLDDSNPAMLRAGNPRLKQPSPNLLEIKGNFIKGAAAYMFTVQGSYEHNTIVSKPRYFSENTYLPEYDYTASAGSTLLTRENRKGKGHFSVRGEYNVRCRKLKSIINLRLNYEYERHPGYLDDDRVIKTANIYTTSLGITGNFSSVFTPSVNSETRYVNNYNGSVRNELLDQTLALNVRLRVARSVELNSSNNLRWNINRPQIAGVDRFGIVSNLSLGYLFGEKKNLSLSAQGHDLFNKKQRTTVYSFADYISSSYTRTVGRYVMLCAEWKF